jgi:GT2 family glycosyltransferase
VIRPPAFPTTDRAVAMGASRGRAVRARAAQHPFPDEMSLVPRSRNPILLQDDTISTVLNRAVPAYHALESRAAPLVTILVVTFNNLLFTRMCLESLLANTHSPTYELLVVDNGSTDGTPDYLRQLSSKNRHVRVLLNDLNAGFAAANNQALSQAAGRDFVLLNNDTIVPEGWLADLVKHLDDPHIGLVGPTTNRLGNEAEIETTYRTYGEFRAFAEFVVDCGARTPFDIEIGSMFCLALRRSTYQRLGTIDERFRIGMFEDVDYSERARAAGLRVVCTRNAFVHHFGSATFGKLAAAGEFGPLFHENRRRWEAKWNRAWRPPSRLPNPVNEQLHRAISKAVEDSTLPDAAIVVVSKGDEELIRILERTGRRAWHFPQMSDGTYAGHHPADSREILVGLGDLCAHGAEYLLIPSTSNWWLDHYPEFARRVTPDEQRIMHDADIGSIYKLQEQALRPARSGTSTCRDTPRAG